MIRMPLSEALFPEEEKERRRRKKGIEEVLP